MSSSFGRLFYILNQPTIVIPPIVYKAVELRRSCEGIWISNTNDIQLPPDTIACDLLCLFFSSVGTFLPVFDSHERESLLAEPYSFKTDLFGDQNSTFFHLTLAIALAINRDKSPTLDGGADAHFLQAISTMETTRNYYYVQDNINLFRRTLLICIFLLLKPDSGDIWRHLGFAIRLFFDLSHRPPMEGDKYFILFNTLARTLYCLER